MNSWFLCFYKTSPSRSVRELSRSWCARKLTSCGRWKTSKTSAMPSGEDSRRRLCWTTGSRNESFRDPATVLFKRKPKVQINLMKIHKFKVGTVLDFWKLSTLFIDLVSSTNHHLNQLFHQMLSFFVWPASRSCDWQSALEVFGDRKKVEKHCVNSSLGLKWNFKTLIPKNLNFRKFFLLKFIVSKEFWKGSTLFWRIYISLLTV